MKKLKTGKLCSLPTSSPRVLPPSLPPSTHTIHYHLPELPGPKDGLRQLPRVGGAENIHRAHWDLWRLPCPQGDHQSQFSYLLPLTLWTKKRFVCKDQQLRQTVSFTAVLGKL